MKIRTSQHKKIGNTEKCVGEFKVNILELLPCKSCKIRIYKEKKSMYYGKTDICLITKHDDYPEGIIGFGKSVDDTLEHTINNLLEKLKYDFPEKIALNSIVYDDDSEF